MDTNEKYKVFDANHPLDWRMNLSNPPSSLVLICSEEPPDIESTKGISISKWQQSNRKWALKFHSEDLCFSSSFASFCYDVIGATQDISPELGVTFVCERFEQWKGMFKSCGSELARWQIQGLIGEMLVIRDILIPKYGETSAVKSWMNSLGGKQDFICRDLWYEIKTTLEGKSNISISSLDQLDRDDEGHLFVVFLRNTSSESSCGVTINNLFDSMVASFASLQTKILFSETLRRASYEPLPKYDEYQFELLSIKEYNVSEKFPRLRRSKLNMPGIADAEYEIIIDSIRDFEV